MELSEIDVSNYEEYLFDDDIEAWVYGPVVPSVYKACKDGTLENYREQKKEIFEDNLIKDYINGILKDLFEVSDFTLVDIAHSDNSWRECFDFKELKHNNLIDKDKIIDEYATKKFI